ncbi:MAG: amidase [Ilumatobacteraceae bacterium]
MSGDSGALWTKGATELAEMIARREVSSRDVVRAHLERIDAVNGHLNAVVRRLDDSALAAADAADELLARAGSPVGPLHGVPFTVKENIDVAGTPTTSGVPALAHAIAERDAPVVERMRAAGGIPIARTNLPDLGLRVHTNSSLHGLTRNPWHPDHTSGGSSGGEGSALASGMSPIGLGNDIGGSLRNPAHCCGVSSIKPSAGVIPWATDIPPTALGAASQLMLSEGVMARRIADVRLGFDIVRGAHPRDPFSVSAELRDLPSERPLRIAVSAEYPGGATDPQIAAVVRAAAATLTDFGHEVTEVDPPDVAGTIEMWSAIMNNDLVVMLPLLETVLGEQARQFLGFGREAFPHLDQAGMTYLHTQRFDLARQWSEWFDDYDVLLSPTWALPAFEHDFDVRGMTEALRVFETFRPVLFANLFGSPAAVVPAGMAHGLPVGVQVSSWRYRDQLCLTVAGLIDESMGLATPIDPRR